MIEANNVISWKVEMITTLDAQELTIYSQVGNKAPQKKEVE